MTKKQYIKTFKPIEFEGDTQDCCLIDKNYYEISLVIVILNAY